MEFKVAGNAIVDVSRGLIDGGPDVWNESVRDAIGQTWLDYESYADNAAYVAAQLKTLATPRNGYAATVVEDRGYGQYVVAILAV